MSKGSSGGGAAVGGSQPGTVAALQKSLDSAQNRYKRMVMQGRAKTRAAKDLKRAIDFGKKVVEIRGRK